MNLIIHRPLPLPSVTSPLMAAAGNITDALRVTRCHFVVVVVVVKIVAAFVVVVTVVS